MDSNLHFKYFGNLYHCIWHCSTVEHDSIYHQLYLFVYSCEFEEFLDTMNATLIVRQLEWQVKRVMHDEQMRRERAQSMPRTRPIVSNIDTDSVVTLEELEFITESIFLENRPDDDDIEFLATSLPPQMGCSCMSCIQFSESRLITLYIL